MKRNSTFIMLSACVNIHSHAWTCDYFYSQALTHSSERSLGDHFIHPSHFAEVRALARRHQRAFVRAVCESLWPSKLPHLVMGL